MTRTRLYLLGIVVTVAAFTAIVCTVPLHAASWAAAKDVRAEARLDALTDMEAKAALAGPPVYSGPNWPPDVEATGAKAKQLAALLVYGMPAKGLRCQKWDGVNGFILMCFTPPPKAAAKKAATKTSAGSARNVASARLIQWDGSRLKKTNQGGNSRWK